MAIVKIYTKTHCPACDLAKQILSKKGVSFQEYVMDDKPEELKALIEKNTNENSPSNFYQ